MVKKYNNIQVAITVEDRKGGGKFYDGKIVFTAQEPIPFFSLTENELNAVLKGFEVLDERRFGTWKKEV